MRDHLYDNLTFRIGELQHRYGENVHIVANPFLLGQLATLCAKGTYQPTINRLIALRHELGLPGVEATRDFARAPVARLPGPGDEAPLAVSPHP